MGILGGGRMSDLISRQNGYATMGIDFIGHISREGGAGWQKLMMQ
jgi:hypothetical protein